MPKGAYFQWLFRSELLERLFPFEAFVEQILSREGVPGFSRESYPHFDRFDASRCAFAGQDHR